MIIYPPSQLKVKSQNLFSSCSRVHPVHLPAAVPAVGAAHGGLCPGAVHDAVPVPVGSRPVGTARKHSPHHPAAAGVRAQRGQTDRCHAESGEVDSLFYLMLIIIFITITSWVAF